MVYRRAISFRGTRSGVNDGSGTVDDVFNGEGDVKAKFRSTVREARTLNQNNVVAFS